MESPKEDNGQFQPDIRDQLKSLGVAGFGNALEWFDWTLYAIFSGYLAANLFSQNDPTSALLSTLLAFAGGFIIRPIGGWLFGRVGDRYGRKNALVITMSMVALGSLGIAILPVYETFGAMTSVMLVLLRLMQGLAHGGESGVALTYVAEIAPAKRRGFWSSAVYVSILLGVIAATGLAALLTSILSAEAMSEWGWRIGFAIGGILGLYAFFLRRGASESHVFEKQVRDGEQKPQPITRRQTWVIVRNIVMMSAVGNATYYTWVAFSASSAITRGMDPSGAYTAALLAQIAALFWFPVVGFISDKIGRRVVVMAFGFGVMIIAFPVTWIVTDQPWTLFTAQAISLLVWGLIAGIYPALVSEQVPTHIRATSVGWITSTSAALFGGTAPYFHTWLSSRDMVWVYDGYLVILGFIALIAGYIIKETAGTELEDITLAELVGDDPQRN